MVLFTGYGSPEIEGEVRRRGTDGYREKTMPIPTLVKKVRALSIPGSHETKENGSGFAAFNSQ